MIWNARFIRDWLKIQLIQRKLTEENLKLELNYLKSQVNPHFLFNSLNNLYAIAIKNDDNKTASGLSNEKNKLKMITHTVSPIRVAIYRLSLELGKDGLRNYVKHR